MIDLFSLFLTHGLIAIAIVRLLLRKDLDAGGDGEPRLIRRKGRPVQQGQPGA